MSASRLRLWNKSCMWSIQRKMTNRIRCMTYAEWMCACSRTTSRTGLCLSTWSKIFKERRKFWVGSDSLCLDKIVQYNNEHGKAVLEIRDKACGKRPQQDLRISWRKIGKKTEINGAHARDRKQSSRNGVDVEKWQATNLNFGSKIMVVAEVHRGHKNTRLKLRQTSNRSDIKKNSRGHACTCSEWRASNHEVMKCCT